jgi:hypothetical protein
LEQLDGLLRNGQGSIADLTKIAQSILAPLIKDWLARHEHAAMNVLIANLSAGLVDFGLTFIQKAVVVPTWHAITKADPALNWHVILERPENLLNERFLDEKI